MVQIPGMDFPTWVEANSVVLTHVQKATGLGYMTIQRARQRRSVSGRAAKLISAYTRATEDAPPAVSVEELVCPPAQAPELEQPARGDA